MQLQNNRPVLKVQNLSFSYGERKILDQISFALHDKEFLALIGPNGGGKSTLLRLIAGLLPSKEGEVVLFNNSIGYVGQNTNINIHFPIRVIDVVMMGVKGGIFSKNKAAKTKALQLLKQVNMQQYADAKIGDLSGGQRQRVMIARALFSDPKILLLDEPTSNIDADGVHHIYELLQELNKKITIILVSHDLSILLKYASRVLYINKTAVAHDLEHLKLDSVDKNSHVCEVELLEMLGKNNV